MSLLQKFRHIFADNQILVVFIALLLGIVFPAQFKPLAPFSTLFLILIFFTSSLRLSLQELVVYIKDWKLLLLANFVMLIFMPLMMWLPIWGFAPEWSLAFLIVGAMPTGLTIALIADLFGGKAPLAMLVSASTSLLAPITIPFMFQLLIGQRIAIPVVSLFSSLFITIVIPFLVAMFVKSRAKRFIERHDLIWREASLVLFGLLIAGIVAGTVKEAHVDLGWSELGILLLVFIFMGGTAWLAYGLASWRTGAERITLALCMVYMNNTLALYIGDRFFHEQNVVPQLLVILIGVNALLLPIKWAARKILKPFKARRTQQSIAHPIL